MVRFLRPHLSCAGQRLGIEEDNQTVVVDLVSLASERSTKVIAGGLYDPVVSVLIGLKGHEVLVVPLTSCSFPKQPSDKVRSQIGLVVCHPRREADQLRPPVAPAFFKHWPELAPADGLGRRRTGPP